MTLYNFLIFRYSLLEISLKVYTRFMGCKQRLSHYSHVKTVVYKWKVQGKTESKDSG